MPKVSPAVQAASKAKKPTPSAKKTQKKKEIDVDEIVQPIKTTTEVSTSTQRGLIILALLVAAAVVTLSFMNLAGSFGHGIDTLCGWLFGWGRFVFPFVLAVIAYMMFFPERYPIRPINTFGLVVFTLSTLGLLHTVYDAPELMAIASGGQGGGYIGLILAWPLLTYTGIWATLIILLALFLSSFLLMFNASLNDLLDTLSEWNIFMPFVRFVRSRMHAYRNGYEIATDDVPESEEDDEDDDDKNHETVQFATKKVGDADSDAVHVGMALTSEGAEQMKIELKAPKRAYRKIDIPMTLLTERNEKPTSGDIEANKEKIRTAFHNFGIEVEMDEVSVGPMVTQYALKPSEGVKLTQITALHNDIALALAAHPIRIEAPIPGKSLVGIEVPNKAIATVSVKEILESKGFKQRKNNMSLALGKDVSGKPYIPSLASMPHVLIAGATGSGKSVCVNSLIVSLLYQNSPDDLKFIMVDPKRVELSVYNGIPHLLTPVITDVEKTMNALKWAVTEMDRRYELLATRGKKNIGAFNDSVDQEERLPYIVFIIDELADLMTVAANSVETAIVRLAQMARAIGIHLVLATQRPSVDVITGLIKANMPARVAFSVASLTDSRTILDFSGAEKLLGKGDMLYIDAQLSKPKRVQGAYLADDEIERIVAHLRSAGEPQYNDTVTEKPSRPVPGLSSDAMGGDDGGDELLEEAKKIIIQSGKASASLLQRRLRVGYARAARLLDILEEQGIIGPADGAKPREILIASAADAAENAEIADEMELEQARSEDVEDADEDEQRRA
ncbi:MAG: DNA translocase FtsK [Candidatus Kerfeldbacteria bacterium]|nr:DNA translocase FtsK [Candidatus Kerfeldbacteria bacterium]